jgi:hypothetical protein
MSLVHYVDDMNRADYWFKPLTFGAYRMYCDNVVWITKEKWEKHRAIYDRSPPGVGRDSTSLHDWTLFKYNEILERGGLTDKPGNVTCLECVVRLMKETHGA